MNWFVLCYSGISCFVFQVLGLGQNPVNEQGKTIASRMAVLESVGFSHIKLPKEPKASGFGYLKEKSRREGVFPC